MAQIIDLREKKEKQFHSTHILACNGEWKIAPAVWDLEDSSPDNIVSILTNELIVVQNKNLVGTCTILKGEWK